ncbi:MAG TPA: OmpA family protein [Variovorax sp.]
MRKFVLAAGAAALVLAGCASVKDTERSTGAGSKPSPIEAGKAAGAAAGYLWSQRMEDEKRQMQAATQGTGVMVSQTPANELKLVIPSDVSFEVGRAVIQPEFAPVLDRFAAGLRNDPMVEIRIIGHTDSTGTDAINLPLSSQRAAAARDDLVARGVPAGAIRIEGRGAREPIADNATAAGRAQNRRVEIYVGERPPTSP